MKEKETLASKNAKPTPEEVAFSVIQMWFCSYRVFDFEPDKKVKSTIINCGLAHVDVYKTTEGYLFEIWPFNWTYPKGTDVYHLHNLHDAELPDDFKKWFIDTIDRMYGWNNKEEGKA